MSILTEADNLINNDRQADYGHPADDFTRIAGAINSLYGTTFTARDIPNIMICVKLSRSIQTPHNLDHITDIAGYAGCTEKILEHQAKQQAGTNLNNYTWNKNQWKKTCPHHSTTYYNTSDTYYCRDCDTELPNAPTNGNSQESAAQNPSATPPDETHSFAAAIANDINSQANPTTNPTTNKHTY